MSLIVAVVYLAWLVVSPPVTHAAAIVALTLGVVATMSVVGVPPGSA